MLPGKRASNPPLGLATVAALCPGDCNVEIIDENVQSIPLAPRVDIVRICGMGVQFQRQRELLCYYRKLGYFVVVGGSSISSTASSRSPAFRERWSDCWLRCRRRPCTTAYNERRRLLAGANSSDNTKQGTNVVALRMRYDEMIGRYRGLYRSLITYRDIAERIRNKLRFLGTLPATRDDS